MNEKEMEQDFKLATTITNIIGKKLHGKTMIRAMAVFLIVNNKMAKAFKMHGGISEKIVEDYIDAITKSIRNGFSEAFVEKEM